MSAAEIIEQIKALPLQERVAVREFVMRSDEPAACDADAGRMADTDFQAAKDSVLRDHAELLRRLAQ